MSDRALLFLFGVLMIVVCLGASGWLIATGQAATVDGLFLMLMALLSALAFALYLMFLIGRAMQPDEKPAAKAAAKPAAQQKTSATVAAE